MRSAVHLALQHLRLGTGSQWTARGDGVLFAFVRNGSAYCHSPGASSLVSTGDVMVVNGAIGAAFVSAQSREADLAWFLVRLDHLYPLFESTEIPRLNQIADGFARPRHFEKQTPLAIDCHRLLASVPREHTLDHRSQLLRLVTTILTAELEKFDLDGALGDGTDLRFLQVVKKLSSEDFLSLSVVALAQRFGYGRRHLNRLFHKHFGVSVASLRMEMRLTKAVSLLRDPSAKITAVASDCGFNHLGLFNTCFKRRFGVSPGAWRKARLTTGALPAETTGDFSEVSLVEHLLEPTDVATAHSELDGSPIRASRNGSPSVESHQTVPVAGAKRRQAHRHPPSPA